jgi:hypothetical protein
MTTRKSINQKMNTDDDDDTLQGSRFTMGNVIERLVMRASEVSE